MGQRKAHEVDSWLSKPDTSTVCVLIYGPDRGLVSERASLFAAKTGLALDDAFSVIRYDASELESDPGRLIDEARVVPMFGGKRLLWIRNAGSHKGFAAAIAELIASPMPDATLLIEAGDLKKNAPLRDGVERASFAMALPCYVDEERTIVAVLDQELERAGKSIEMDARQALRRRLGGDRLASRGEIDKLLTYVGDAPRITLADVEASTGDVSANSIDEAIDAALAGSLADLDRTLTRALEGGAHAQVILGAATRQFQSLEILRRQMDFANASAGSAVAAARPPVFFTRRKLVESVLARSDAASISRALERLASALLQTRRRPDLSPAIVRQALISLTVESARGHSRR
ncbi:MAG: DNA polymerase III subunit delta [Mesorhizobium sp.]